MTSLDPALSPRLVAIADRLDALAWRTATFWFTHGPDEQFGGFHGRLDDTGRPAAPSDKSAVQQARHLWSLATWYERREPTERIRQLADSTYRFLVETFLDAADAQFHFLVTREGKITVGDVNGSVAGRKLVYAQSFAIYALATYGRVFGNDDAVRYAVECFASVDTARHDELHGGYDLRQDCPWLSEGASRETNTLIHVMEALAALCDAAPSALVRARLTEMVHLTCKRLQQPAGYLHLEFSDDYTPFGPPEVSYGHDLETSWLVLDAERALGGDDADIRDAARRMAELSAREGFDEEAGGYFLLGTPGGRVTQHEKVWWVQFEALPGLWRLFEPCGDRDVLRRLEATLAYLERTERPDGEWYWSHMPDGSLGGHGTLKGHPWKTSYHGLRAAVFTADWIRSHVGEHE